MPQWFRCRNSSVTVQESDGFGLPHTQKVFRGRLRTRVSCGSLLASTNCDGLIPKLQSAPRSRGTFCTVSFLRLSLGCHRLSWQRQSGQSSAVMATSVWAVIGCHGNVSLQLASAASPRLAPESRCGFHNNNTDNSNFCSGTNCPMYGQLHIALQ